MDNVIEYIIIGCLLAIALLYIARRIFLRVRAVKENEVCKECLHAESGCGKTPADCR